MDDVLIDETTMTTDNVPAGRVYYEESEAGGIRWLDDQDYQKLQDNGWERLGVNRLYRDGLSLPDAIQEWESILYLEADNPGCDCCGKPHKFFTKNDSLQISLS